jgi:hypothetical protein
MESRCLLAIPPHPSLSPVAGERTKERGTLNDWNGWNGLNDLNHRGFKTFKPFKTFKAFGRENG